METNVDKLTFRADLLREALRRNGLSQSKVANLLGLNQKTVSKKMNGYTDWTLREIQNLQDLLPDINIAEVFKLKRV